MKAYQTPQERYDIDIKKISLVRPQGRGQGKFRVFTTPKGGMYLGVLSDSGNSILETGHFSDAEKQLLSLHKARDCLGWSAAQDKKPKHNECLPCKRKKILGQQEKNLELCSSNKTPLDCWKQENCTYHSAKKKCTEFDDSVQGYENYVAKKIKGEVASIYGDIRKKVLNTAKVGKDEQKLPPGLRDTPEKILDKIYVPGSTPYLFSVNTYAFERNGTVIARIGDSGYNRHFFTGSSLNTGMLSTLDLLTKCGAVRSTSVLGALYQTELNETKDVSLEKCTNTQQVSNYNKSQTFLQSLIPKEVNKIERDTFVYDGQSSTSSSSYIRRPGRLRPSPGNENIFPSRVSPFPIHLNCHLILFFVYFVKYSTFFSNPYFFLDERYVKPLNEEEERTIVFYRLADFADKFYPDFCQMIAEQPSLKYTKQIINSLLSEGKGEWGVANLVSKWCRWGNDSSRNFVKDPWVINSSSYRIRNMDFITEIADVDWGAESHYDSLIETLSYLAEETNNAIKTFDDWITKKKEAFDRSTESALRPAPSPDHCDWGDDDGDWGEC